jgi:hypothetical protein
MKEISKEEIFGNLKSFLKSKGINLEEGSYSTGIRKGCDILTDTVNLSQRALERAKDAMDKGLDQVRQTVHEKTAPKSRAGSASKKTASSARGNSSKKTSAKAKTNSAKGGNKRTK